MRWGRECAEGKVEKWRWVGRRLGRGGGWGGGGEEVGRRWARGGGWGGGGEVGGR